MKVENISTSALIPYEGNPRIHSDNQIQKLQESIREYGIVLPVLIDAENVILSGHAVVRACQNLEIAEIPCIRDTNLTEAQKHAYILAANRLAEDSSWDKVMLKTEMLKLRDEYGVKLENTGFEAREILRLRMDVADTPKDEDTMPEEVKNPVSQVGDLWILGDHRLICGSCTDKNTVERLLDGSRPHLMVTDPPYGVNYDPEWRNQVAVVINRMTYDEKENEIKQTTAERNANAILIAHAPEMYELLKAIRENMPILAGSSELDGLFEAVFNAGRLLSRIDIESNAETEDAEP